MTKSLTKNLWAHIEMLLRTDTASSLSPAHEAADLLSILACSGEHVPPTLITLMSNLTEGNVIGAIKVVAKHRIDLDRPAEQLGELDVATQAEAKFRQVGSWPQPGEVDVASQAELNFLRSKSRYCDEQCQCCCAAREGKLTDTPHAAWCTLWRDFLLEETKRGKLPK